MENASKALIIAGSILIAILIISLGVMVFRNMSGTVKREASLDKQQIQSFNAKILPYIGNNVSGSQVNALIQLVRTIDQKAINEDNVAELLVKLSSTSSGGSVTKSGNDVLASNVPTSTSAGQCYYEVTAKYGSNGLINEITIKP